MGSGLGLGMGSGLGLGVGSGLGLGLELCEGVAPFPARVLAGFGGGAASE